MTYAFDLHDTTLEFSLRRIAGEELGDALTRLRDIDQPAAVHSVRKHLKKTRALLRLLRPGFAAQPAENAALRTIALALATRRDAAARLTTFDGLFPDPPEVLRSLRDHLAAASQSPASNLPRGLPAALNLIRERSATWSLHGKDTKILRQGLSDTRRKAIRATKAAKADPASEVLIHDWRKRVKDHWYQARLFAPCWPDLMKPLVDSADRLGQALGDHHDLTIFALHVAALPDQITPAPARRMLNSKITRARARIEAASFPFAAQLFAGDPDKMAELWVDWRAVWRRGA